jgi:spore germination cell wall hydrolase CwlJ-like protein
MKIVNLIGGALSTLSIISMAYVAHAEIRHQLDAQLAEEFQEQQECLALNIYHEARGDSTLGQRAVAHVTMNRVMHHRYPETVCDVIFQARLNSDGNPIRNQCQFSWYCDGRSDEPANIPVWNEIHELAGDFLREHVEIEDVTDGAIMYHAHYVNPYWADDYDRTVRIDTHIFYK